MAIVVASWAFLMAKPALWTMLFLIVPSSPSDRRTDDCYGATGASSSGTGGGGGDCLEEDGKAFSFLIKLGKCLLAVGFDHSAFNCFSKNSPLYLT